MTPDNQSTDDLRSSAEVSQHLSALMAGNTTHDSLWIGIWHLPEKTGRWFSAPDPACAYVSSLKPTADVYVHVGVRKCTQPPTKPRASTEDIDGRLGFVADLDCDRATANAIFDACGLAPTITLDSGHGIHAWWLFEHILVYEQAEELKRVEQISRGWHERLCECAERESYPGKPDSVHDLARVMRVAGTVNNKRKPVPVTLLTTNGPRYDYADFAELVPDVGGPHHSTPVAPPVKCDLDDRELLEKARNARNGEKFRRLYDDGDISEYKSHSEADLALASMLCFWTDGDGARAECLFSASALGKRDKWVQRPDYRAKTIAKALESCTEFYSPVATSHIPARSDADGESGNSHAEARSAKQGLAHRADPSSVLDVLPDEGFLREYFEWASPCTDAPKHFHIAAGLVCIAAAVGNRCFVNVVTGLYPNLYVGLIAPSSRYRKTTVTALARRVLVHLEAPTRIQRHGDPRPCVVLPDDFSLEALFQTLSERPTGVLIWSELAVALSKFSRSYLQGAAEFFTDLFDCPPRLERRLRREHFVIERPCVTIFSGTTANWLTENMSETTAVGGFLPRFIFFGARKPGKIEALPPAPDEREEKRLADRLAEIRECYDSETPVPIGVDEIRDDYTKFVQRLDDRRAGGLSQALQDAWVTRLTAVSLKLALLIEVAQSPGSRDISPDAWGRAERITEYLYAYVRVLVERLTFTEWGAWRQKALDAVRDAGEQGLTKTDLTRGALRELDKSRRDRLLEALEEEGVLTVREGPSGKAGPPRRSSPPASMARRHERGRNGCTQSPPERFTEESLPAVAHSDASTWRIANSSQLQRGCASRVHILRTTYTLREKKKREIR